MRHHIQPTTPDANREHADQALRLYLGPGYQAHGHHQRFSVKKQFPAMGKSCWYGDMGRGSDADELLLLARRLYQRRATGIVIPYKLLTSNTQRAVATKTQERGHVIILDGGLFTAG